MKHININNLGPLRHAEVDLEKFNVVIGPQSSGKSCLMLYDQTIEAFFNLSIIGK
ncbi:MAG: ATP-binding protein [Bacteroidales bacterium]|nr:ATP-binding protein [Bacteroidales bacterium]